MYTTYYVKISSIGANISPGGGIRGNGVMFQGGNVLLDGNNFKPKPQKGITILIWIKLMDVVEKQTVFETVGSHSEHDKQQYRLEIVDGAVNWFHRNEEGVQVFNVKTSDVLKKRKWYNIAVVYDEINGEAKVYLDGKLKQIEVGKGELSQDWGAIAAFGTHFGKESLKGFLDDIYMYRTALHRNDIRSYVESFREKNAWIYPTKESMSTTRETRGTIPSTTSPKNLISAKTTRKPNFNKTTKKKTTRSKSIKSTKAATLSTTAITTPNSTSILATSTSVTKTEPLSSKLHDTNVCTLGEIFENADLKGGLNAGNFLDRGLVNGVNPCMALCCLHRTCDLAYIISARCYLVECYTVELCAIVSKSKSSLSPTIGLVSRPDGPKSKSIGFIFLYYR